MCFLDLAVYSNGKHLGVWEREERACVSIAVCAFRLSSNGSLETTVADDNKTEKQKENKRRLIAVFY